jgi:CheY-like chemotaxis protein
MNGYQQVEILLVEDSAADAEMTLRTLKRRGIANSVEWVRDGVEALDWLHCRNDYANRINGHPKLVLLDLKMPRMDGLQLLEVMKSDPSMRAIPVVMMTSSREEGDLLASYGLGVNSYVVKPVDFSEFAERIAQIGMYWMIANQTPVGSNQMPVES